MLCCKCNKRPAVVFVSDNAGNQTKGYCLSCANELGIKPVKDLMQNMGITDEQLESMQDSMDSLIEMSNNGEIPNLQELMGDQNLGELLNGENDILPGDDNDPDRFSAGGAPTFPFNLFGGADKSDKKTQSKKKVKKENDAKRKHLDAYCTNLTERAKQGKLDRVIGRDK